ncbi:hypothetical protein [Nocardioides massiliensis]|uniref:hypothetical protein n=1 Tax=Nocardioides massiliensis TaxID=1325935 RepID=UPI0027D791FE|nr:hypothetical protein [Nocardioides massiliensis]
MTSPRARRPRPPRRTGVAEIDRQSLVGEVYMTSLLRAQLRLAVIVLVALTVTVGALPLVFLQFPGLNDILVLGMPLPWVMLAFGIYPVLVVLGWLYVRAAERNEQAFADVVERS